MFSNGCDKPFFGTNNASNEDLISTGPANNILNQYISFQS